MIASGHRLASEAGLEILRLGGSSVDAAIAAQMVLSLVEPQSSGIGGGGFLMHFNNKNGVIESYDGRESAPQSADASMFLKPDGTPKSFFEAAVGGAAIGVPGLLRMLELAHLEHGKLSWANLFSPAIRLAENGFTLSPRLAEQLRKDRFLREVPTALRYFYNSDGTAKAEGAVLKNPAFAQTMRRIAEEGANAFYQGPIAESIVFASRNARENPGGMTLADLANYRAIKREPVCNKYRFKKVCGMGPPSSGGITTLQILGILSNFNMRAISPTSSEAVHLITQAGGLAFADRDLYIGDNDFVSVPIKGLINSDYLARRTSLIDLAIARMQRKAGLPKRSENENLHPGGTREGKSTTHLSIIDEEGNAVSMTSSIETAFGSRQMASGFLLNNQLTDFSFWAKKNGKYIANRAAAGKRPRSSMSPTLVVNEDGSLMMAIGSPGGSRIIGFVSKVLVAVIDWNLSIQEAINLPNFLSRNKGTELEKNSSVEALRPELEARGHIVNTFTATSGLHGIHRTNRGLKGGVDPRREGVVLWD